VEAECGGATIGEVIAQQRSRVEIMLADQREQLRLHAEAVQRHEERGRLRLQGKADQGGSSDGGPSGAAESASNSMDKLSNSMSEMSLPSSADGSSSSVASASVVSSSATAAPADACSWTAEHTSLESLRAPGRKKYGTIMKVALRFLHSLRPASVNRNGGSHVVFHFGSGSPVTLVQPHSGGRSKDGTKSAAYCTRLYQSLHAVALQQFGVTAALPSSAASDQRALPSSSSSATSLTSN